MKKEELYPVTYPLFESAYGSELPSNQLYLILFKNLPSKYFSRTCYDLQIVDKLKDSGYRELIRLQQFRKFGLSPSEFGENDERLYINENKKILIKLIIKNEVDFKYVMIEILYDISQGEVHTQFPIEDFKSFERKKRKANISLIKSDMGHLEVEDFDLPIPEINLEMNYGSSFLKIHELILKRLNSQDDKGIILLHGDPGTGKTSYIKYLTKLIENKEILFVPPTMAETLSEPSFIPFLMEHKNSILIIEDAERVISDRETNGSSTGVSNILNLTDGILGDCLGIQIIATFNMRREKIDQALLRKGRLIAEHKFQNLSVEDTNKLLLFLKKDYISKVEMSLADIYNIDIEQYKTIDKTNKIGFAK